MVTVFWYSLIIHNVLWLFNCGFWFWRLLGCGIFGRGIIIHIHIASITDNI